MESKNEIRKRLRKQRMEMDKKDVVTKSNIIADKLIKQLNNANKIALYCSIQNEVDIASLLFLKKHFFLPKTLNDTRMEFFLYEGVNNLKVGPFDILEPTSSVMIDGEELDLIIVPLIGFDDNLNRIGQGKGYYDRYLKNVKCKKIGVAYESQHLSSIETDEFDVNLDMIITEEKIYTKEK